MKPDVATDCSQYMKALADPIRLQIVNLLRGGKRAVSDVAESLGIEIQNASHHLRVLANVKVVLTERQGRHILYSLNDKLFQSPNETSIDFGCCRLEFNVSSQSED